MVLVDLEFLFSSSTSANSWDIELKTRRETLCLRPPCIIHKLSWIQKWRLTIYPDGMHNWITSVGNKTPTLQRCPFVLLFLCRMFCYHYYSCFVINTSSIVKDIIIIMTVILVNMFIIIAIVVQIWSAEKFK